MIALWPCLRKKPDSKANCTTAEIESVFQICDVCELFFSAGGSPFGAESAIRRRHHYNKLAAT